MSAPRARSPAVFFTWSLRSFVGRGGHHAEGERGRALSRDGFGDLSAEEPRALSEADFYLFDIGVLRGLDDLCEYFAEELRDV